jgi:hypothetical protein
VVIITEWDEFRALDLDRHGFTGAGNDNAG